MQDGELLLNITRLFVGTIILSYASYTDIKTRKAANMLWVIMGSIGAILLAIHYFTIGFDNIFYLAFIPIMIAFMFILFQLRLIFGGADAKAIMALAVLVPIKPAIFDFPIWEDSVMPFSWVIFSNAVVLFITIPLSLLIYNTIKRNIEFPYCVLGYKMSIDKAKQSFVWPLEKIKDGKRKFSYMPKEAKTDEELKTFENEGVKEIWVTPKVPFMIPLLAGFLVSFSLGDILSHVMHLFI
ncbi:MAG: prepilin peptidase [Thermoplasmatales archaeon]|nr:MAG: prepilin peptidase [Thermoplasmatales archaeon]